MADTPRQRTTLETIFANNNSQSITAQDIRDLLASTPLMTEPTEYGTAAAHDESYSAAANSPNFTGTPTGLGIPIYSYLSTSAETASATATDSGLSVPVVNGGIYEYFAFLACSTTNSSGNSYTINGTGTTEGQIFGTSGGSLYTVRIPAFDAETGPWMQGISDGFVILQGIVSITGGSTVKIQHLAVSDPVPDGVSIINPNSFLRVTKIA